MIYVALVLLLFGTMVTVSNIGGVVAARRRSRSGMEGGYSNVPLLSFLSCAAAWALAQGSIGYWAFVPAICDPGTWVLAFLPRALIDGFKNPPKKNAGRPGAAADERAMSADPEEPSELDSCVSEEHPGELLIDVSGPIAATDLHDLLAEALTFPAYYGRNWDAFWDCITDPKQSRLPTVLTVVGFAQLRARMPRDAGLLQDCLLELPTRRPECRVVFEG